MDKKKRNFLSLLNILFYVPRIKESHTILEQHDGEFFWFWFNCLFGCGGSNPLVKSA